MLKRWRFTGRYHPPCRRLPFRTTTETAKKISARVLCASTEHNHTMWSSVNHHNRHPNNNNVRCYASSLTTLTSAKYSSASSISSSRRSSSSSTTTTTTDCIGLHKVLIANRGEIACRIHRTCQKWDIPTVAIYSSADTSSAWHAQQATESYLIGSGPAVVDSYLRQDDIISRAIQSGCDAIHPGYGFLSENSSFASKCQQAGIKFIGPSAAAMESMGDKAQSKAIMEAAGVPTTPGYYDPTQDPIYQNSDFLYTKAMEIGFPLLIKAVAGGGGKGMRTVWNENDFISSLESCQRESISSFGNSAVLLEKFLVQPRHVEIQIIADSFGNVVHLYERDCSVQRRHQKVFEEAPALDLSPELRYQLGAMGKLAAQAVQYVNAGTVEFLLDTTSNFIDNSNEHPPFYFCEMNTRLQVEHPVTESITGIDLVEWQLRVAAGQPLPIIDQENIPPPNGHAIEARIYAERQTSDGGFLPATGTLWHHDYQTTSTTFNTMSSSSAIHNNPTCATKTTSVRVDTGLRRTIPEEKQLNGKEQSISVYYDPMISKLIVHGPNRDAALRQMVQSLRQYQIAGVPTNIPFLLNCAQHPVFQKGGNHVNTGFLDDYGDEVKVIPVKTTTNTTSIPHDINDKRVTSSTIPEGVIMGQVAGSLAIMLHMESRIISTFNNNTPSRSKKPWSTEWGSWRIGQQPSQNIRLLNTDADEKSKRLILVDKHRDGSYDIYPESGGKKFHVTGWLNKDSNTMEMIVNGSHRMTMTTVLRVERDESSGNSSTIRVRMWPNRRPDDDCSYCWELDVENPQAPSALATFAAVGTKFQNNSGIIKSPMPGKITRINYSIGDTVSEGDVVVVMEAMKMEHPLISTCSGRITEIRYQLNDVVTKDGAIIFVVQNVNEQPPSQEQRQAVA